MNFEENIALTQDHLLKEADSLGKLLERLRDHVSPMLIGHDQWEQLLDCARELPPTIIAFPFGFEIPLHNRRLGADFGVSVVGGTRPASFFKQAAQSEHNTSSTSGISRLLSETDAHDSRLRQIVGRKMMLEFDIDSAPDGSHPDPGIFLRPAERPIIGDGAACRVQDVNVVLDAIVSAAGWTPNAGERRQVQQVYRAQTADTRIESFGAFPSRERAVRLALTGFRTSSNVMAYLERVGWNGDYPTVAATISPFEERNSFVDLGIHLDVYGDSLGPKLGLSLLAKKRTAKDSRYWLDQPGLWTAFIDVLRSTGLTVSEKLHALENWTQAPTMLFGESGVYILLRGIHHFKLVLTDDRVDQVKAYAYMVLMSPAPS